MNFFGHAVMAAMESDAPRFVLGAMLPDLSSMAGARIDHVRDHEIARGVEHHHRIDHAFHACAPFVKTCSSALDRLEASGVSRGAARAVAHVGSELLLDGALSARGDALRAYERALQHALAHDASASLALRRGESADMALLFARLAESPLPGAYLSPAFVHARLERILARRPRLALQAHEHEPVLAWLHDAQVTIGEDAAAIIELLSSA